MSRIIRVFPRRTKATPADDLAYVGGPDMFAEADAVHISVSFTWDLPRAERLEREWRKVAPTTIGGPAAGSEAGLFRPGVYLRTGYVITSRGCPNRCPRCYVPSREGLLRELPITSGWIVQDNNLLACSELHVRSVFAMLAQQRQQVRFTGGLEAARLEDWHVGLLIGLRPRPELFFAYDSPADLEPLQAAGRKLLEAGFTRASHSLRCYVLCGYQGDSIDRATTRMKEAMQAGFTPCAMLWAGDEGSRREPEWLAFRRLWMRPAAIYARAAGGRT